MRMKVIALASLVAMAAGVACSDPEAAKQRAMAAGDEYVAMKKYQEAIIEYRNAVRADEKFGEARLKLARAYLEVGDNRNALRESVRAADLLPENTTAQLRAGTLLFLSRQLPEAQERARAVLRKEPKNAEALVLYGNTLAGLKELDAAIEQIEEAVEQNPRRTLTYTNLGMLQLVKGNIEAAESMFKRAVEVAPQSLPSRLSLANFLWAAGRASEAERELKAALNLDPKSDVTNRALATFYITQNRLPDAEPYLKAYSESSGDLDSQVVLADYYVHRGKIAEAKQLLASIGGQKEGAALAAIRFVALDVTEGRSSDAHRRLEELLREEPAHPLLLEAKARLLLLEDRRPEALKLTTSLVQANPESRSIRYLHGIALEATGSAEEAAGVYQSLFAEAPTSLGLQMKLVALYLQLGRTKEALPMAQQAVKLHPRAPEAHFLHGQALLKSKDLINAERELEAVAKAFPSSGEAHAWLGLLYEEKGDLKRARRSFETALKLQPHSTMATAGLVAADLEEKRPAAALARVESELRKYPRDARLLTLSGLTYMLVQDLARAEEAFRKVLEIDGNNMEAYNRLAAIYLSLNRLDDARKNFEDIRQRQAKPAVAETMIGTILLWQNRSQEARAHFERAVEIDPRSAVASNNLAWDYANSGGNLDVALQLAQAAKTQLPDIGEISDTLGWIYYRKGLTPLAVSTLQEAAKQSPSNPGIRYRLGLAYLQNGDKTAARSTLEAVLTLNPKQEQANEARRVLATIKG